MFAHVEIKVLQFQACRHFYNTVLEPLGIELKWTDDLSAGYGLKQDPQVRFLIEKSPSKPLPCHMAFEAPEQQAVDAFFSAGLAAGYTSNGAAGLRADYAPNYYAAFLLDPDGNNIEALVYL